MERMFHVKHSRLILPRSSSPQPGPFCRRDGMHWHPLYDPVTAEPQPAAIEHEWLATTGHVGGPDPRRQHFHKWPGVGLVKGPNVAERPGGAARTEEEDALTLHPELRPARLRDA